MVELTSVQLNYLIFRYLCESGFQHTAFTLGYEAGLNKIGIDGNSIPPGALVSLMQKGLQYMEIEANINEDGSTGQDVDFSLLMPHDLLTKNVSELRQLIKQRRQGTIISEVSLEGHTMEVLVCAWNPTGSLLASGSSDSTARVWKMAAGTNPSHVVLNHGDSHQVTALGWNADGSLLASASINGLARLWTKDGRLRTTLQGHTKSIFSIKWNKKSDCLLTGSTDGSAIVWDATGEIKQRFKFPKDNIFDVDWRNDRSFAACSKKSIYICKLGEERPVQELSGHINEVNAVQYDPAGKLLASCSDDCTVKIWKPSQDNCVHDMKDHSDVVYSVRWRPSGPGSRNPNQEPMLASASWDKTTCLWNVERGVPLYKLEKHSDKVNVIDFNPNGEFLASGGNDNCLYIWSVKDGSLVRSYQGTGTIFDMSWNEDGNRLAACFSSNTLSVLDIRM